MSFRDRLAQGQFCIPECGECGKVVWPPSDMCDGCLGGEIRLREGPFEGVVVASSGRDGRHFCMAEIAGSVRIVAESGVRLDAGQQVRMAECGIRDGGYFFAVDPITDMK